MHKSSPDAVARALVAMRARYIESIPKLATTVRELGDKIATAPDPEALVEVQRIAHRVHGTAGSYGFATASQVAGEMETRVVTWCADSTIDAADRGDLVRRFADDMIQAFQDDEKTVADEHLAMSASDLWSAQRLMATTKSNRSVILIEDDPAIAALFQTAFEALHMQVVVYQDGKSALEALRALPARPASMGKTLVILGIDLPEMDGVTVYETIQSERAGDFAAVFISSYITDDVRQRVDAAGAMDYLPKPVTLRTLLSKLPTWLQQLVEKRARTGF